MKAKGMSDETKEKLIYGCFFGLILFASSAIYFSFQRNMEAVAQILPFIPIALAVYILAGILLIWVYSRPESGKISSWFKGSAAIYWIGIIAAIVAFTAFAVPELVRHMVLVNFLVIVVCWGLDFCSFMKIANELNGGVKKGRYLVVDIQECPKNVEEFCREIENYCEKSRVRYEFITWGKPAEIVMDGERYMVELDSFYSQFGPMYALKFKQLL